MNLPVIQEITKRLEYIVWLSEKHQDVKRLSLTGQRIADSFECDGVLCGALALNHLHITCEHVLRLDLVPVKSSRRSWIGKAALEAL